jgi:phosphomannomutase/phosphoglucomutase
LRPQGTDAAGLEVAIDCGNGMAGAVAPRLLREIGVQVHGLYLDPDGRFPNHEADPTREENLVELKALVERTGSRVGIGYDGDADRIGVIDHQGRVVWGDLLLLVYARELLARRKATILCDVKCSDVLEPDIAGRGGTLVMWKTGHSLIKAKMRETGAALAGEMSGHMFFADGYLGYDDAIYATLRLLSILARSGQTLPQLLAGLPERVSTPELRVPCAEADKRRVVAAIAERLRPRFPTLELDGVRYQMPNGWGLVRASNTQPVLVARFEARDAERLEEARAVLNGELQRLGLEAC